MSHGATLQLAPSGDFTATVDTARRTRMVIIAVTTAPAVATITPADGGDAVAFALMTAGLYQLPVQTKAAVVQTSGVIIATYLY